jgi:hypothetical protein
MLSVIMLSAIMLRVVALLELHVHFLIFVQAA